MRTFMSNPSNAYKKLVTSIQQLMKEEGLDSVIRAYAEATCERHQEQYIKKYGLKASNSHACIGRLINKRCSTDGVPCRLPGGDHVSLWLKDGKPEVYISQPYHLSLDNMRAIVEFCDRYRLTVDISTWPSWHFPGAVLTVEVKRADAEREW